MDYGTDDPQAIEQADEVLAHVGHGFLALPSVDGWPVAVPLNFARDGDRLYFHGKYTGDKMAALAGEPRVGFTVVEEFALVPSYLRHPRLACPATQYFRSVLVRGTVRIVEDVTEKAHALQIMMEKLQPEGGHEPITADGELYSKWLETTAVLAIEMERISGKFKYGQNLTRSKRDAVLEGLEQRAAPLDQATVEVMRARDPRPRARRARDTS